MSTTGPSPVESIDRALLVLSALSGAGPDGLTLAQLSDRTGVHKTTVHRALAALLHRDFAARNPDGSYALGAGAVTLGDGYFAGGHLTSALHPALVSLARDVDELVHLGVLAGTQIVYLDKVEPERPVRVWSAVGRRMPAATTALGRALLLDRVDTTASLEPYTHGLEITAPRLEEILTVARRNGFTTEREENEPGIACVALPLLRAGHAIAAVSVTAPIERLRSDWPGALGGRMSAVLAEHLPAGITVPRTS